MSSKVTPDVRTDLGEDEMIVVGQWGSPYTRKLLALLRFRRLPHRFILRGTEWDKGVNGARESLFSV